MKRREFIKTSVAATTLAGVGAAALQSAAAPGEGAPARSQEFYELRVYRLKSGANHELLDQYLEKALIPALNQMGIKPVGVFTEPEPKGRPGVFVLIPYPSLQIYHVAATRIPTEPKYLKDGAEYLGVTKDKAAFERIDSWLLLAFTGMPRIELPVYSREKKARVFELRTYENFSETIALRKIDMFNSGEIGVMQEVGLAPVFYGQALIGTGLPHLTYMLSAENSDEHKKHWGLFGKHPIWNKLKNDPKYADTEPNIKNWMLAPTAYSQI